MSEGAEGAPVALVTGGGGGIGAAIAGALGRGGWSVVTLDPLVSLDGTERLPAAEETTSGRIVAAGGKARASSASVTDADAVRAEVDRIVAEDGRLDAVVNVAGITRPTGFAKGTEDDWRSVLAVHLDGYRNVLAAALPHMAAVGRGRVLGVTSGSGWRAADAGAYSCAKRAVAALTWQLGARAPAGVAVNAMSPIAVTRMVTAALGRAAASGRSGSASTGGLSLGSMPEPDELGPLGAHLVSEAFGWCRGQVLFAGGSEAAVVDPPRLLEVVQAEPGTDLAHLLAVVGPAALAAAEAAQASGGGSNPRFPAAFEGLPTGAASPPAEGVCAVVTDRPEVAEAVGAALAGRIQACHTVTVDRRAAGFEGAAGALAAALQHTGPLDAVVVALTGSPSASSAPTPWQQVLVEHVGIADSILADAAWVRAVADHSAATDRPVRLLTLTDAVTAGGRSRAQAAAQLARAGRSATNERVMAFAISLEGSAALGPAAALAAHLVCDQDAAALAGAELVAGDGWVGLRSHPRPAGSLVLGGPGVPGWFDTILREVVGAAPEEPS
ncbi:MAG: SDR family NAD(P)-dependent oxidoreductase [Acidimicrobiia bacterium]|nr:SDR family NAD(P)-dependent oxidoreductase [Acidimicrobiia bacterium]